MVTQPTFEMLIPAELHVPPNRLDTVEGFPFEFEIGRRMVQEPRSSTKGSRNPTTQKSTPKSVEEAATKVMQVDKVIELF